MFLQFDDFLGLYAAADSVTIAALGFVGILATAWFGWLAVKRAKSGKIDTTEAGKLWDEAGSMRNELRSEVVVLRGEITDLKKENRELKADNAALRSKLEELDGKVEVHEARELALQRRIEELERTHG